MPGFQKRHFSHHELSVATATGYIRSIDRYQRPKIVGYPVDDWEPTRATDRDDAVYARQLPDGGYLLEVTIADVAAHIPKDSPLDRAAQQRAFTIYRPPARDPMFPFILSEDRFSLEHEQERLGVTVMVDLDPQFGIRDIAFTRTIIESQCHDYAGASQRMQVPGDDFELLAHIARGLKRTYQPPIRPYGDTDTTYMDKTGLLRHGDAGSMAAAKLVQVLMIVANNEIANFFQRTGLPFLFRNHAQGVGNEVLRAEYEPFDHGHYALQSEGLKGSYSHCTSPIRRYADLINQRMMHYAMDVVESVAGELADILPDPLEPHTRQSLTPRVWEAAEAILQQSLRVHSAEAAHSRIIAERSLRDVLERLLVDIYPDARTSLYAKTDPIAQLFAAALKPPIPYTHDELAAVASGLNSANLGEREAVAELNQRNYSKWNEQVSDVLATGNLNKLEPIAFTSLLRRAAMTGKINTALVDEATQRLETGRLDMVPDCYSILVLCKEYQNPLWRGLKRVALNAIERDPMVVNNMMEKAIKDGEIHPETFVAESMVRDVGSSQREGQQVDAALVITRMKDLGNREYSAPHYSLGYAKKDTARHAKFNFIRALAFGDLGPVDQSILPTPLFAELNQEGSRRAEILHEMVEDMGLTMDEMGPRQRPDGNYSFAYKVYGPGIEHPIIGFVVAPTEEEAREKSATRILRNIQFKRAYAYNNPVELGFPTNPILEIRELAEARGWMLTEPDRSEIREVERGTFCAVIKLRLNEEEVLTAKSFARNKDNALQFCFESLRDQLAERGLLEVSLESPTDGKWVTWAVRGQQESGPASPSR